VNSEVTCVFSQELILNLEVELKLKLRLLCSLRSSHLNFSGNLLVRVSYEGMMPFIYMFLNCIIYYLGDYI
jgi:hypothetical protein